MWLGTKGQSDLKNINNILFVIKVAVVLKWWLYPKSEKQNKGNNDCKMNL